MGFRYASQRWRSDDELLISASEYTDWKATGAWGMRAFRWKVDNGEVTDTPYVGQVVCLTSTRIVLMQRVPDPADPQGKKQIAAFSGGALWEPAVPILPPRTTSIRASQ